MLVCPHCEEQVDGTDRVYCPVCGAQLPAGSEFEGGSRRGTEQRRQGRGGSNSRRRGDAPPSGQSDQRPPRDSGGGERTAPRRERQAPDTGSGTRGGWTGRRQQHSQPRTEPPPGDPGRRQPRAQAGGSNPREQQAAGAETRPAATDSGNRRSFPLSYAGVLLGAGVVVYSATRKWAEANVTIVPEPGGPRVTDGIEIADADAAPGASGMDTWAGPVIVGLGVLTILVVLWDIKRRSANQDSQIVSRYRIFSGFDGTYQVLAVLALACFVMLTSFTTVVDADADLVAGGVATIGAIVLIFLSLCAFVVGRWIRSRPDPAGAPRSGRRQALQYVGAGSLLALAGTGGAFAVLGDDGTGNGSDDDRLVSNFSEHVSTVGGTTIGFGPRGADIPTYANLQSVTFECEDGQLTTTFEMAEAVPELVGGDEQMEFSATFDASKPGDDSASPLFVQYAIESDETRTTHDVTGADDPTVTHDGSTVEFEFSLRDSLSEFVGGYYEDESEVPDSIGGQAVTHYNGSGERIQWVPADMDDRFDESTWVTLSI